MDGLDAYFFFDGEKKLLEASRALDACYRQWKSGRSLPDDIRLKGIVFMREVNAESTYSVLEIIGEKRPQYVQAALGFAASNGASPDNWTLPSGDFDTCCDLLFTVLFEMERRNGISRNTIMLSFYSNVLLGIYWFYVQGKNGSMPIKTQYRCEVGKENLYKKMRGFLLPPGSIRKTTVYRWINNGSLFFFPRGSRRREFSKRLANKIKNVCVRVKPVEKYRN